MKVYRILNNNAKNWWYFKELRKRGQHKEARLKERESILKEIGDIRKASKNGYFAICRITDNLHYFSKGQNSSSSVNAEKHKNRDYQKMIIASGIPTCSTEFLNEDDAYKLLSMPILKFNLDKDENYIRKDGKFSSCSYVTKQTYKKLLTEQFGHKVSFYNWN